MTEPESHTLVLLRELRQSIDRLDKKADRLDGKLERGLEDLRSRMDNLRHAVDGESVLGRYAAAEVEERLTALEERVGKLETTP